MKCPQCGCVLTSSPVEAEAIRVRFQQRLETAAQLMPSWHEGEDVKDQAKRALERADALIAALEDK